ncbi:MAG: DUF111 family protein [Peptoniphilaceae bacterium]|nr:DUF111 family protein [Peptoniphilaceae bacterium]
MEVIETNIDDSTGENLGFLMEILLKDALDVFYVPIFMKKNRPAYKLSVILNKEKENLIVENIFKYSTSIGIRKYDVERKVLKREQKILNTSLGDVNVKFITINNEKIPRIEYESLKEVAIKNKISLEKAYNLIMKEI